MSLSKNLNATSNRQLPRRRRIWRKVRQPLANSGIVKHGLGWLMVSYLRLVWLTNRKSPGFPDIEGYLEQHGAFILVMWHGQHLLAPAMWPRRRKIMALFSRSADAELNAIVAEKFGIETVRGSGGPYLPVRRSLKKGGARALLVLKRGLAQGKLACLIADIRTAPRSASSGSIALSRISGRPIVPIAITSRRKVIEKSWDGTTINLPFGHVYLAVGRQITVPKDADADCMERLRRQLTDSLNSITEEAYRRVDTNR